MYYQYENETIYNKLSKRINTEKDEAGSSKSAKRDTEGGKALESSGTNNECTIM